MKATKTEVSKLMQTAPGDRNNAALTNGTTLSTCVKKTYTD